MNFGSAWYPEHWPESRWAEDLRLMKEARMDVVRVAEFAWSTMEPEEGNFQFGWLDRAIELAASYGIQTVLGTPSAAPPAWLTSNYPDTLRIETSGLPAQHGNRVHFNPWSKTYRRFCARIAEEMARRYGKNKNVIGWQFCNEYSQMSYDAESRAAFQDYLKGQYKTLKALNDAYCGAYWSEDYSDWKQIPMPIGGHNPGLRLDFQRFFTETYISYQKTQIDAIKPHIDKRQWMTHNFMGWFGAFDHYGLNKDLDMASWDSYWPVGTPDPAQEAVIHDLTRGFKRKNFWLMETQPNAVNWAEINQMLEPGRLRLRNLQAVAHGADAVLYWQWRNALGGQEQLHGSVVGADGKPRPAYVEISRIGRDLEIAGKALSKEASRNQAALLNSYDARWALEFQPLHKDYSYVKLMQEHSASLYKLGLGTDVINATESLDGYKLVIVPGIYLLEESTARNLEAYVKNGGQLLVTSRTGYKQHDSRLYPMLAPGPLAGLCGVEAEDSYPLIKAVNVSGKFRGSCNVWSERLRVNAKDTEIWAKFGTGCGWIEGKPAIVSRKVGKGRVTTTAGCFDSGLNQALVKALASQAGLKAPMAPVGGVEAVLRPGLDGDCLFVLNHSDKAASVNLPAGKELFSGKQMKGKARIPAREVWLLQLKGAKRG